MDTAQRIQELTDIITQYETQYHAVLAALTLKERARLISELPDNVVIEQAKAELAELRRIEK